jgi:serine/threonine-protein kinase
MQASEDIQEKLSRIDELERAQRAPLPRPFGAYTLVESLAKGGMGEVFLARVGEVEGLQKHCVVKTLRPHLTDDREYVARFIDEARVVVQLNHKNVCQVFDVGMVGERYYLAMELVAGVDLRMVADAAGPMDPALATFIAVEVLDALDYAHRLSDVSGAPLHLVHRDVSPQNVMCSFEGEVKLIDFGLAQSAVKLEKTSPQTVMGKLAYMAPEQLRGEAASPQVDLYATAIVLVELLLGARFYEGMGSQEVWTIAATGGHLPKGISSIEPGLQAILRKALSVDVSARYPHAPAFRQALMRWRASAGTWADGPTLRALMADRCAAAVVAHRERLQQLRGVTVLAAPVAEPTRSFALASSPPSPPSPQSPPSASSPTSGTPTLPDVDAADATAAIIRQGLPKARVRASFVAAVAAAVGVIVVAAVAIPNVPGVFESSLQPTAALVGLVPVPVPAVDPVAPGDDVDDDVVDNSADLVPVPAAVPVIVAVPQPASPPPAPATATATTTKTRAPSPPPAAPPAAPPASPKTTPPPTGPAWDDVPPSERAALLRRRCPQLACVADIVTRSAGWGGLSRGEMTRFTADLEGCRRQCPGLR